MKIIPLRKPTLKPSLSFAIFHPAFWVLNLNLALAQHPSAPLLPEPNEAQPPGVFPNPAAGEPSDRGGFGGGLFGPETSRAGNYALADRLDYGYHPASAPAVIIQFSQADARNADTLQEDLNVMSLVLQKKIESAFGEDSPTYRMGIPLLLRAGQRGIESLFLDGFGAVFTVSVNFPLVPPPAAKVKESDPNTGSDDWDIARKELYGARETDGPETPYSTSALPYNAEQVGALKRALLDSLRNAANIRALKSDEWVVVTVFGTEGVESSPAAGGGGGGGSAAVGGTTPRPANAAGGGGGGGGGAVGGTTGRPVRRVSGPYTARPGADTSSWYISTGASRTGRGTVLTVRVRKSDAESFAKGKISLDQFEQKATIAAYLGPAPQGSTSIWRGASFPGRYPFAPAAR